MTIVDTLAVYILGALFFALPVMLTWAEESIPIRDAFFWLIIYPLWLIPLILLALLILMYCFILNKTLDEGIEDTEIKINECKIFVERLFKR